MNRMEVDVEFALDLASWTYHYLSMFICCLCNSKVSLYYRFINGVKMNPTFCCNEPSIFNELKRTHVHSKNSCKIRHTPLILSPWVPVRLDGSRYEGQYVFNKKFLGGFKLIVAHNTQIMRNWTTWSTQLISLWLSAVTASFELYIRIFGLELTCLTNQRVKSADLLDHQTQDYWDVFLVV